VKCCGRVHTLVNDPAFDFGELCFDWGDVVLAAVGWGAWQQLERWLAAALASAADARAEGDPIETEAPRDATLAFRRARGLLSADDYLNWLAERGLSTDDVRAHLTRAALCERVAGDTRSPRPPANADTVGLVAAIRAEAVLSGRLRGWAERLARAVAAERGLAAAGLEAPSASETETAALIESIAACEACGLSASQAAERAARIAPLLAAEREFEAHVVTSERIERCLEDHRLDWQRLVWEEVEFASAGAAREAALEVRADGLALGEVAVALRAPIHLREAYCGDLAELAATMIAAVPGELLGPFAAGEAWRLACVRERRPPAAQDPVLRSRAAAETVADALERHLAGVVSWHVER
jgi:hypothetical protein